MAIPADRRRLFDGKHVAISAQKRRCGHRRIHVLLRRENRLTNNRRIWTLYSQADLTMRSGKHKRIALLKRMLRPLPTALEPEVVDGFVSDGLARYRRFRCLNAGRFITRSTWRRATEVLSRSICLNTTPAP